MIKCLYFAFASDSRHRASVKDIIVCCCHIVSVYALPTHLFLKKQYLSNCIAEGTIVSRKEESLHRRTLLLDNCVLVCTKDTV